MSRQRTRSCWRLWLLYHGFFKADLAPVTKIQHELMNHALKHHVFDHAELDQKFIDLFAAMSALEGEYI